MSTCNRNRAVRIGFATLLGWPSLCLITGCAGQDRANTDAAGPGVVNHPAAARLPADLVKQYTPVHLTADLSALSPAERKMIPLLVAAADQMDRVFWLEFYGDKEKLLGGASDTSLRRYIEINYGPWDRIGNDAPFLPGAGPKPAGANFYPADMTKEEFERHLTAHPEDKPAFTSQYTVIRRDAKRGLIAVPYRVAFAAQVQAAAAKMSTAASLAEKTPFGQYLALRADALLTDDYDKSDIAWLAVKDSPIDYVVGPIEHYEDGLYGRKTTHEATIFIKDVEWSRRLAGFVPLLPDLQKGLPVPEAYRKETPGSASDLGVYDAIYATGYANVGAKPIGVNLPNDEKIQLEHGARRLEIKNVMRAKYDKILVPIVDLMIAPDQRRRVTFDAMFEDVLFHEIAHGLGIKNTITGKGIVREALREQGETLEEAKADIVGLHLIAELRRQGKITDGELLDNYVTYIADIMRLNRFGGTDAYGQTSMLTFNFLKERGAIARDPATGTYRAVVEKMTPAVNALAAKLLTIQGNGDYDAAKAFAEASCKQDPQLEADLQKVRQSPIPVDLVYEPDLTLLSGT
jgi:hypothetical protein